MHWPWEWSDQFWFALFALIGLGYLQRIHEVLRDCRTSLKAIKESLGAIKESLTNADES